MACPVVSFVDVNDTVPVNEVPAWFDEMLTTL
jgi:hypothetical protein